MAEEFDPSRLVASMAPLSLRAVALQLHVDPAILCRPLTINQADRYALALGMHPAEVWGAQWVHAEVG